jgi:hypothetical protein
VDIMTMTMTAALRPQSEPRFVVSGAGRRTGDAGSAWAGMARLRHQACLKTQPKAARTTNAVSFNVPQHGTPPRGAPS